MLPWMQEATVPDLNALLVRYDELRKMGLGSLPRLHEAEELLDDLVDLIRDDTLPCAYCGTQLGPDEQSAPPWVWPGFGVVSACYDCTGNPRPHKASGTTTERE